MVKNKILIVTGMHRSHTSLASQWLHKCGLNLGDDMMGAGNGNDDGHYEDFDFLHAHQDILKARRLDADGFTDPLEQLAGNEADRLHDIISYKNGLYLQWGWKDPRTCLFLTGYRQLVPQAFYFVVLRDSQSVVSSLITRMFKKTEKKYASRRGLSKMIWVHVKRKRRMNILLKKYCQHYLKSWINYNEAILQHLEQISPNNYLVTDFSTLYEKDKAVFDHLANDWGFSLNFLNFKSICKPDLLHTSIDIAPYIKDKSLLEWAADVEASLKRLNVLNANPIIMIAE